MRCRAQGMQVCFVRSPWCGKGPVFWSGSLSSWLCGFASAKRPPKPHTLNSINPKPSLLFGWGRRSGLSPNVCVGVSRRLFFNDKFAGRGGKLRVRCLCVEGTCCFRGNYSTILNTLHAVNTMAHQPRNPQALKSKPSTKSLKA